MLGSEEISHLHDMAISVVIIASHEMAYGNLFNLRVPVFGFKVQQSSNHQAT